MKEEKNTQRLKRLKKDRERLLETRLNRVRESKRCNKVIINKEKGQTFDKEGIYLLMPTCIFL